MQRDRSEPGQITAIAVVFEGGLGLAACAAGWLFAYDPTRSFRLEAAAAGWGLAATVPLLGGLAVLLGVRWRPFVRLRRIVNRLVIPLLAECSLWQLAVISLAAGVGEELLFRGLIQGGLSGWTGEAAALVAASLLFGLAHPITQTYVVLAALIGLYLGGLWLVTGNLLAPIVAHAAYDFCALVLLIRRRGRG